MPRRGLPHRREFLASAAAAGIALAQGRSSRMWGAQTRADRTRLAADPDKALIAITLDLEMSRNFPTWEETHWDYEKGNLNEETKRYTVEACRRVKEQGGVLHTFAVGRVFEQEDVSWLKGIADAGHPIGNHTYDHVYVLAKTQEEIQFRFRRSPWLIEGRPVAEVIDENIRLATKAMEARLGVSPRGFRTPGGFQEGLRGREDVQRMLQGQGYDWVSSLYPAHDVGDPMTEPTEATLASIVEAQERAQPFLYPTGLIEIPMSPISDVGAFRGGRWKLEWFKKAVRLAVERTIEKGSVFDFLGHPSCLYVVDPNFETIDLILELVANSKGKAAIVDLDTLAERVRLGRA